MLQNAKKLLWGFISEIVNNSHSQFMSLSDKRRLPPQDKVHNSWRNEPASQLPCKTVLEKKCLNVTFLFIPLFFEMAFALMTKY